MLSAVSGETMDMLERISQVSTINSIGHDIVIAIDKENLLRMQVLNVEQLVDTDVSDALPMLEATSSTFPAADRLSQVLSLRHGASVFDP